MKEVLKTEMEDYFRPEFLNRLDEIIVFHKLTHKDLISIVDLELDKLASRLQDQGKELEVTREAKDYLIDEGTDEKFGARPLRRAIESILEDALSEAMLRGDFKDKNKILVSVEPSKDDPEKLSIKLEGVVVEVDEPEMAGAGQQDET